ncbi:hypothetical protein CYMTET_38560 [Cymbomonas tetramitiformis]|uniref:Gamma-glutamyltransferase n=1 Tax=Cymbomonas tetramitiformis TaxID=36881 RepID=A0AAE0CBS0_9CHLO|nr:hypothetical protein CYMTET_38560 [Cymbomonas tetramitiformis]
MDDFSSPGMTNTYGLHPSQPNYIKPGKRPLSSMSPTVVLRGGKLWAVLGASGGPRIITATVQTLLGILAYGRSAVDAVRHPRLHHQLLPNHVASEHQQLYDGSWVNTSTYIDEDLRHRGHQVENSRHLGYCNLVMLTQENGELHAVSDKRKAGGAAGY